MTAKEKAKQIVRRFLQTNEDYDCYTDQIYQEQAIIFALILVNEILAENKRINLGGAFPTPLTAYWKEVRKEITRKRV